VIMSLFCLPAALSVAFLVVISIGQRHAAPVHP